MHSIQRMSQSPRGARQMSLLLEKYSRAEILEASLALMFEASLLDCAIVTRVTAGGLLTMLIGQGVVSGNDRPMTTPQYREIVDLILKDGCLGQQTLTSADEEAQGADDAL